MPGGGGTLGGGPAAVDVAQAETSTTAASATAIRAPMGATCASSEDLRPPGEHAGAWSTVGAFPRAAEDV
jgi:hypothetical protein